MIKVIFAVTVRITSNRTIKRRIYFFLPLTRNAEIIIERMMTKEMKKRPTIFVHVIQEFDPINWIHTHTVIDIQRISHDKRYRKRRGCLAITGNRDHSTARLVQILWAGMTEGDKD
jgi:hypothetical protein